jgi:UDP-2,3-diacylglucosamine hydrolase
MPNGMPQTNPKHITLSQEKKVYFVSDHHFGLDAELSSSKREKKFVLWLEQIKKDAAAVFILGDLFDFWYEYKHAVSKGFVRVLAKLAELTDMGIDIRFFVGNHDMWMRDYFPTELKIPIYFKPQVFHINNKVFLLGHGDGLGPGDKNYKLLKKIF